MTDIQQKWRTDYLKRRDRILAQKKLYYIAHKEQRRAYNRHYRQLNAKEIDASNKLRRQLHIERTRATNNLYAKTHREKASAWNRAWREKNRERSRSYWRKWTEKNRYKLQERMARRRLKVESGNANTKAFYNFVRSQPFIKCYYCGVKVPGNKAHIDHIIALARDGNHSSENLCASCPSCNLAKGTKLPSDFSPKNQMILNL